MLPRAGSGRGSILVVSKHTALSATVTVGTAYTVIQPTPPPTTTHTAQKATVAVAGPITVTPRIPD